MEASRKRTRVLYWLYEPFWILSYGIYCVDYFLVNAFGGSGLHTKKKKKKKRKKENPKIKNQKKEKNQKSKKKSKKSRKD